MATYYAASRCAGRTPQAPVRRPGAWKLAYADFLTALCAFFLVMWLVHGVTLDQKADLAEQFGAPPEVMTISSTPAFSSSEAAYARLSQMPLMKNDIVNVDVTSGDSELRIELADLDRLPLFEPGNEKLNKRGQDLIALAADAINRLGYTVSIEGHTDSRPVERADYSNWELSAGRANAARRALVEQGVTSTLIVSVTGYADTRPIAPEAPYLPQNRRLSIVFHLE